MAIRSLEKNLVNACLHYLTLHNHFVWRNNSGVVKNSYETQSGAIKHRMWRAGKKGSSDIIGIADNGRFIAVECKIKPNKPTPEQEEFLAEVRQRGGFGIIAYSIDDLKPLIWKVI